jgi:hypothetical protein
MTGDHISADKPVAFFVMCKSAFIPQCIYGADYLFQQLAPVQTWGKNFFVPVGITYGNKDFVRIVASQDETHIEQTGSTVRKGSLTLNAGQYVELEVAGNGCYITANKPIGVCAYPIGADPGYSDPAQAWISPIEQCIDSALMTPFILEGNTHASYLWQDERTDSVYVVSKSGTYSVTVSNACGSVSDKIEINAINCELEFTFPDVFTPVENVKEFQACCINLNKIGITIKIN